MSALKTMLQYGGSSGPVNVDTMAVYATNVDDQNNSGCCCLWTVPAGVTWFSVEMWGGGGGGAGSCCCQFGTPGGAGSYSRKIINTTAPGQTYRFCAAGSTYCSQDCGNGCDAYPTYVYGTTEAVNIACASGGHRGCNFCWGAIGTTYMGCSSHLCGSWCGGFGFCGAMGAQKGTAFCSGTAYSWAPTAPFVGNFFRPSRDACAGYCCGCGQLGYSHFPGGGGGTPSSHNTYKGCGAAGAGGLILVEWHAAT